VPPTPFELDQLSTHVFVRLWESAQLLWTLATKSNLDRMFVVTFIMVTITSILMQKWSTCVEATYLQTYQAESSCITSQYVQNCNVVYQILTSLLRPDSAYHECF